MYTTTPQHLRIHGGVVVEMLMGRVPEGRTVDNLERRYSCVSGSGNVTSTGSTADGLINAIASS